MTSRFRTISTGLSARLLAGVAGLAIGLGGLAAVQAAPLPLRLRVQLPEGCLGLAQCAPRSLTIIEHAGATAAPLLLPTTTPSDHPARRRLARTWTVTLPELGTISPDSVVSGGTAQTWEDPSSLVQALRATSELEEVAVDPIGRGGASPPDDPSFGEQWALYQSDGPDVGALQAWDITMGAPTVVIAVIDTGVDLLHPDLAPKILPGYDFVNNDDVPADDYGHGTLLAGVAAASTDDGYGTAGMCPRCAVLPVKVLNELNFGYFSWWTAGIVYAVDHGADVLNLSLGGAIYDKAVHDAVKYAVDSGVVVVSTMMNEGNDVLFYPGALDETIAVGATGPDDARAQVFWWGGGSNYGPHIDLVAPGVDVLGPVPGDLFEVWSGTSISTAYVSGVAGLMRTLAPQINTEQVRALLRATVADQVGRPQEDVAGFDDYHGYGRLDAAAALGAVTAADSDGDGVRDVDDCAPQDPAVYPGATEVLNNGLDDDCDPATPDFEAPTVCPDGGCDLAELADTSEVSFDAGGDEPDSGARPLREDDGCCSSARRTTRTPSWGWILVLVVLGLRRTGRGRATRERPTPVCTR